MFPRFTVGYSPTMFSKRKGAYKKVVREFNRLLQREVKPEIQKQVDDLLGEDPGPVKHPFVFDDDPIKNARIRAAFFATKGFGKGIPYRRTDSLRTSWRVDIIARLQNNFIVITNPKKYAKYVYRPRQLPGHKKTGWGRDMDTAIELISEHAVTLVSDAWQQAVSIVLKAA